MSFAAPTAAAWAAALARGRWAEARSAALEADGPDRDPHRLDVVDAVARVATRLLEKSYGTALRPLEDLGSEARAIAESEGLDLGAIEHVATRLVELGKAVDSRNAEDAEAQMADMSEDDAGPFVAERWALLGTLAVYRGDDAAALAAFEAAVAHDPRHVRARTNLGNLALERGDVEAAIAHYESALEVDDEFANAHHNLGVAYRRLGRIGASVKSLRTAQRISNRRMREEARRELTQGRDARWLRRGLVVVGIAIVVAIAVRYL